MEVYEGPSVIGKEHIYERPAHGMSGHLQAAIFGLLALCLLVAVPALVLALVNQKTGDYGISISNLSNELKSLKIMNHDLREELKEALVKLNHSIKGKFVLTPVRA